MFFQTLELLTKHLHLQTALSPDDEGKATLYFAPQIEVVLTAAEDGVWLQSTLAVLQEKQKEEFLSHAMKCNLFGHETGGAILGCDREGKVLLLLRFILDGLDEKAFLMQLEEFVNYAEAWRAEYIEFGRAG